MMKKKSKTKIKQITIIIKIIKSIIKIMKGRK